MKRKGEKDEEEEKEGEIVKKKEESGERSSTTRVSYREDIDGLRGVAVLSVILFHFCKSLLPGGFTGVDVFFVISGFLITSNILKEMKAGKFSFSEFYSRRVKRIFPASAFCILLVLVYSWLVFFPSKFGETAQSGMWGLLSSSNFYNAFNIKTGYFGDDISTMPLMHLWSLAVEEQFYMIWPILMLFLSKKDNKLSTALVFALILGSTLGGEIVYYKSVSLAYYMLPTRMGEMMVGSLLAFHKPELNRMWKEVGLLVWYS